MIIDCVRKFIKTCPLLQVDSRDRVKLGIDYLDNDTTTYSLEEVPVNPIIKKYIDGSSIRQATFIFSSREPYGPELQQQLENSGFYEDFSEWISKCNANGILPILDSGKECKNIEVITSGYAFNADSNNAVYQIQINLKYFKGVD